MRSVSAGGSNAELFYFLGTIQRRLGKETEAEESFKNAIQRQPQHKECLQSLAMIYMQQQRYLEAVEQFKRVTKIDTAFYPGLIGLGTAYSLSQMVPEADSVMRKLFAIDSAMGFQMLDLVRAAKTKIKADQK